MRTRPRSLVLYPALGGIPASAAALVRWLPSTGLSARAWNDVTRGRFVAREAAATFFPPDLIWLSAPLRPDRVVARPAEHARHPLLSGISPADTMMVRASVTPWEARPPGALVAGTVGPLKPVLELVRASRAPDPTPWTCKIVRRSPLAASPLGERRADPRRYLPLGPSSDRTEPHGRDRTGYPRR